MKQFKKLLQLSNQDIEKYIENLKIWQNHVNLISKNTIPNIYNRHILDSAQLWNLIPDECHTLVDVGSGGGFPGIILAILNKTVGFPISNIFLVESDIKKSTFLKEINRQLKLNIKIINDRIENIINLNADVITARAFSKIENILLLTQKIVSRETIFLLPKGKDVDQEIKNNKILCKINKLKSLTDPNATILKISEVYYEN